MWVSLNNLFEFLQKNALQNEIEIACMSDMSDTDADEGRPITYNKNSNNLIQKCFDDLASSCLAVSGCFVYFLS